MYGIIYTAAAIGIGFVIGAVFGMCGFQVSLVRDLLMDCAHAIYDTLPHPLEWLLDRIGERRC